MTHPFTAPQIQLPHDYFLNTSLHKSPLPISQLSHLFTCPKVLLGNINFQIFFLAWGSLALMLCIKPTEGVRSMYISKAGRCTCIFIFYPVSSWPPLLSSFLDPPVLSFPPPRGPTLSASFTKYAYTSLTQALGNYCRNSFSGELAWVAQSGA